MLHVPLDKETEAKATAALSAVGLSVPEAVRLFLHRVAADQGLPLELKVPNAETRSAMAEADTLAREGRARFGDAETLLTGLEEERRGLKALGALAG
ncbi:type II toxin-antitoxin system RelB/DinJ family antitoxin [Mangrovicella endophytica]|uniref:type II toxin-antitoxin system RelB/DinJ family antitoxin n=1 Tax=Mangrovicella endophytica TaxID=2066697 RepID=UPI000C9E82AD|nr:type II toxin-antitoxin system RelB/DinJ family antitoxin [Mangrovicella endophytica]